ncbi:hypothetical protein ACFCVO_14050 [Agromyces sp. NPDC056379]|uniref:hypothetical protein n=1 Tax=unclassified Agromyces TaxID=2639701 RepID=UPI0035D93764
MSLEWPEWFLLGLLTAFAVLIAVSPAWMSRPSAVGRFARAVGLPLDGDVELEQTIRERLRSRARWGALGSMVGAVASALVVVSGALTTHDDWGTGVAPFAGLALACLLLTGRGIGTAISILPAPPEVRRNGPRLARLPRPVASDYVAPIERVGARVLVAVSSVLALGTVLLPVPVPVPVGSRVLVGASALGAIAVLVVVGWVSSALVARPQPAVSEQLLRWDDALRAQTLRDLVSVPLMFGALALITSTTTGLGWVAASGDLGLIVMNVAMNVLILAGIVVVAISIAVKPARYYLKRLWPVQYSETEPPAYGSPEAAAPTVAESAAARGA